MPMPTINKESIFYRDLAGSKSYRIPSLLTTTKGTVIAGIDARIVDHTDNPNEIDASIRRSFDDGKSWEDVQKIVAFAGEGFDGAAAIDTALLEDEETNTIFMLYCHTPGGIGLAVSETGIGFTTDGKRQLYDQDGREFHLHTTGEVTDAAGNQTDYHVDRDGYVFLKNEQRGNIYYKKGIDPKESLLEARTSFLQVVKSDDDGATWSAPIELNGMVKESWMRFIGAGPGRGVQIKHGKYKGRIVFPIYFSNAGGHLSCTCIYSDDHGTTWVRGDSPNDGRELDGEILSAKTISEGRQYLTESQVIEMPSGSLRYYMRNHHERKRTAVATSQDGGQTWGPVMFDDVLVDPICQSSVIRYPDTGDGKTRLLFSNPNHETIRKSGTIRLSEDGGQTWPYSKVIEKGNYGYSCLTVLANGEIGLTYERVHDYDDWNSMDICFVAFSLDWLKS
jgi:sialidase-1